MTGCESGVCCMASVVVVCTGLFLNGILIYYS